MSDGTTKRPAEDRRSRWHDTYQQSANATDEFLGDLLDLLPGAKHIGSDAWDQIPRAIKTLRGAAERAEATQQAVVDLIARYDGAPGDAFIPIGMLRDVMQRDGADSEYVIVSRADLETKLNQRGGHGHSRPGVWDGDNRPEIAGQPCVECAAEKRLRDAAGGTAETGRR